MSSPEHFPIERALVVVNEHSSNAARMRRQIGALSVPTTEIYTSLDSDKTFYELTDKLADGMAILSAGGDGTTNQVANMLLHAESRQAGLNKVPYVPLRGGNANDIAIMFNGTASANKILQRGRQVDVSPLEVTINCHDPIYALGYFSIGGTAAASAQLESVKASASTASKLSGAQFIKEAYAAWTQTADQEPFMMHYPMGESLEITDALHMNGNRMAKIGRPNARMHVAEFEFAAMKSEGRTHTLKEMFKLAGGKLTASIVDYNTAVFETLSGQELMMQFDGETARLRSGSEVSVESSTHTLRTISTQF